MVKEPKETIKETIIYMLKKKTVFLMIFVILIILAVRVDFKCARIDGKWDISFGVKNLNDKIKR
jgi:hypothetical protein